MSRSRVTAVTCALGAAVLLAVPLGAQAPDSLPPASDLPASRYLPLDDPVYRHVDLLVERGVLTGLNPMVRPYRRMEVARAVVAARRRSEADDPKAPVPTVPERAWLDRVARELAPEVRRLGATPHGPGTPEGPAADDARSGKETDGRAWGRLAAGTWGLTHRHRDPLRPTGDAALFPFVEVDGAMAFGSVVAHLGYRIDGWLVNDPQFPDGNVAEEHPNVLGGFDYAGRAEEAYVAVQVPHVELLAGRTYRNWGLAGTHGLLVSGYPYSYDQVGYRVGSSTLRLTGFVAPLDTDSTNVRRWVSAHRLDWRPSPDLGLAVTEEVVYGGENRGLDWALSNPVNVWIAGGFGNAWNDPNTRGNNLTELAAWWRPSDGMVTYLAFMIDRFPSQSSPWKHGLQASVRFPRLGPRLALRMGYTQVATMAYQTRPGLEFERVAFRANGLGRDLADYDRLSVEAVWLPRPELVLRPGLALQRRGEEDFRDPVDPDFKDAPVLHSGQVETTLRASMAGDWRLSPAVRVGWDVGSNFVWDAGHVPGRTDVEAVGRVRLEVATQGTSGL